jgi:sulfate transport system substrate-binding protein
LERPRGLGLGGTRLRGRRGPGDRGTGAVARAYLEFLHSPLGQDLIAKHFYRSTDPEAAARHRDRFVELELVTIADLGGWPGARQAFRRWGLFDRIYSRP